MPSALENIIILSLILWGVQFVGEGCVQENGRKRIAVGACMILLAVVLSLT